MRHDRTRAKVEWYATADLEVGTAVQYPLAPSILDFGHADDGPRRPAPPRLRVAPQASVGDDRSQAVHMDDMVNRWADRNCYGHASVRILAE